MRLLNVRDFTLHTFYGDAIPPYAILSHTWLQDIEEVTFAAIIDATNTSWRQLPGAQKILYTCKQAADDGLLYAWIDTCCIDKTNSVELSEAINSMFKWYQRSSRCYAYLMDIDKELEMEMAYHSRWWGRAWTLQELIAPERVHFYDKSWRSLGTKSEHAVDISRMTRIDRETLEHPETMYVKSVAQKMSWAARREATRVEDRAYSLLGMFEVNLTMQYGEGVLAFMRLQEMILQKSNDQTLFSWGFSAHTIEELVVTMGSGWKWNNLRDIPPWCPNGMSADSPSRFAVAGDLTFNNAYAPTSHIAEQNGALRMSMLLANVQDCQGVGWDSILDEAEHPRYLGILPCDSAKNPQYMIGVLLEEWERGRFRRIKIVDTVYTFLVDCHTIPKLKESFVWIDNHAWISRHQNHLKRANQLHRTVHVHLNLLPTNQYIFGLLSEDWKLDAQSLTLEQHQSPGLPSVLQVSLYRRTSNDYIMITVRLGAGSANDSELDEDKVCMMKRSSVRGYLQSQFVSRLCSQTAELEGVGVLIDTHQVYNHMISSLRISAPGLADRPQWQMGQASRVRVSNGRRL